MEVMSPSNESYQKLFLRGYPIKLLSPIVIELLTKEQDLDNQKKFIANTVGLPIIRQYPLKIEYMQSLLRLIILELENRGIEVCDELYEMLCKLNSCNKNIAHYRHYMLSDSLEHCITVEENTNFIAQGTTGLHTWQASQTLFNWCTSHKFMLQNKCILELGSGVGLAGLAVSLECDPQSFWFSDCHPSVLGMLLSNVKVNVDRENKSKSSIPEEKHNSYKLSSFGMPDGVEENILYQGRIKNTNVHVMNLPWEDIADLNISKAICPDVVLAADLVYDTSILEPLCNALCHLVKDNSVAIMACTIRNEDTTKEFLEILGKLKIAVDLEEPTESLEFLNLEDMPIRIYKLSHHSSD